MSRPSEKDATRQAEAAEFEQLARKAGRTANGPLGEFWYFVNQSRKWWMLPILLMLMVVGTLLVMAGTAVGPFIYALF
jgi:hypothetical protein